MFNKKYYTMKTKIKLLEILAPISVATSLTAFTVLLSLLTIRFGFNNLHELLSFMPKWVIIFVGCANVLTFLPIFFIGFFTLSRKGAIGMADKLRTWGIYKYVRNPMYSGVSFTFFGLGLILGKTGLSILGIFWLIICYFTCKWEEKHLENRFGNNYIIYKSTTPMFIPEFDKIIRDLIVSLKTR